MKRLLCILLCFGFLSGVEARAAETKESLQILESVWAKYPEQERFSVYGGMMNRPVEGGPGVLDTQETEELQAVYLLMPEQLEKIAEGASMVHLMSRNIFTAAAVRIQEEEDFMPLFSRWRDSIQRNHWIGGRPERVLMARVEQEFLVMVLGTREMVGCFQNRLKEVYKSTEILYNQAVQG